mmetsp:Transcript_15725/g.20511  ORF Transcript_15725/g.20511 Transcript_15725/m.20511 type:complete len:276 (+) Transcript_15725:495-1322(+)
MVTWSKHIGSLWPSQHGTNRHTSTQGLGRCKDIRLNAQILVSPKLSRSSHADLYLIHHHECTSFVANFPNSLEEFRIARNNATFSLKCFHHDCGQSLSFCVVDFLDSCLKFFNAIVSDVFETLNHLSVVTKSLVILGLCRGGQGSKSTTVEGLVSSDNDRFGNATIGCMTASTFNGSFVGFRSRVTEKSLLGNGVVAQPGRQSRLRWNQIKVGDMVHFSHLFVDGGIQFRVAVTKGAGGNSRNAVQEFLTVRSVQLASFSVLDNQWITSICLLHI